MDLPTTSYAVLGLLSFASMSGYDLAQAADGSIANFWPISKSQVYGELRRLEELGFVRGRDVEQEKRPDKRVFELAPAGREALDEWLESPDWQRDRRRLSFLVKVFFGHRMAPESFLELVGRYRSEAEAYRRYLQEVVDVLEDVPETVYQRATALFGLRSAEATIAWADEVAREVVDLRERVAADPGEVAETSRRLFEAVPPREEGS